MIEHMMRSTEEIPEDLRCKRTDGKQWRCTALSMPDKTVCEKHYIQAKKRATNSALRASLKKARRGSVENADAYTEMPRSFSPMDVGVPEYKKFKDKFKKSQRLYSSDVMGVKGSMIRRDTVGFDEGLRNGLHGEERHTRSLYNSSFLSKEVNTFARDSYGECYAKSSELGGAGGLTCHQCRRNNSVDVVWCASCDRKGYCSNCISQWYADIPVEDIRKICPACRGICNCKACLCGDNLIKNKVREIASIDKLRYLHSLLSFVLPVLKQIYSEQCFEIAVETRVHGVKTDVARANLRSDEQMYCNLCRVPIFDFHRHCPQCSYDLCLTCCRDIRRASLVSVNGEPAVEKRNDNKLIGEPKDEHASDLLQLFLRWKSYSDGSIPCAPEEAGGCSSSKLVLRRILKLNWAAKLVKNAEEIVTGCKVSEVQNSDNCASCPAQSPSLSGDPSEPILNCWSHRNNSFDNILYHPSSEDLKHEGISHFHKHWLKGEPVIVKHVFDHSLASSWDPMSIWKGIQELEVEEMPENDPAVKAIDYFSQSEVDIELSQFIKGYSEGLIHEDGRQKLLMLRNWPPPSAWEEYIFCQRPEFITNLPLVEFIHSKWGLLNLAAKLPHDTFPAEAGAKIYISYGTQTELGRGDPVTNLRINMGDLVYLLMHSAEGNIQGTENYKIEKPKVSEGEQSLLSAHVPNSDLNFDKRFESPNLTVKERAEQEGCGLGLGVMDDPVCGGTVAASFEKNSLSFPHFNKNSGDIHQKISAGAIWDVFRRQDVPKLNDFLRIHAEEFSSFSGQPVKCPIYKQSFYLDEHSKRKLEEEYGVKPWSFGQNVGEAIFVPAGCPFQLRNLQSTVQLGLDFLSPESLKESAKMAQDIRCLPNNCHAKLNMWEVEKMTLYAASSAIREIQRIILDPKLSSDIMFEDRNLTATVSENLERITKRKQIPCT